MKLHEFRAPIFRCALSVFSLALAATLVVTGTAQAAPPQLSANAVAQVRVIDSIKNAKSATQRKIDSRLYLGMLHERRDSRLASLSDFRFVKAESDNRVAVDIVLTSAGQLASALAKLDRVNAKVLSSIATVPRVYARVHLRDLETIAAFDEIRAIRQHMPALTNKINTSEGDATHDGPGARADFATTGAGVKVCALSDGVDSLASVQASGDLPADVNVLSGQAGDGDEGTAMLEIIHDVAPGAALGFAQGGPDEAGFAQNIISLAISGCNIIVDDITYLDESPFEDGPVARAVNIVTNAGVLYFSSAGNEGNKDDGKSGTWEGDFKASATTAPTALAGMTLHDFGDGGNSIKVTNAGGNYPILIWA
ncbi:MAG TPA: hypothetical protein VFN13_07970 [Rudaea sp.]|nr:hypothetical protein [Rudaea sp.]